MRRHADECLPPLVRVLDFFFPNLHDLIFFLYGEFPSGGKYMLIICLCINQDMGKNPPTQELVAKDLHGVDWRFRHIFRGNDP